MDARRAEGEAEEEEVMDYVAFGNDELARLPAIRAGDEIDCPVCGGRHVVEDSTPPMLLFYNCGDKTYMAGLNGRNTMGRKP